MSTVSSITSEAFATLLAQAAGTSNQERELESFGYFLEDYVIEGAALALDATNPRKFTLSEAIISFDDGLWRVYADTNQLSNSGPYTYYVDFTVENGFVVNTSHPSDDYLPLWQVNTDATGNITSTVDMRGTMGFLRFRSEIQGVITDDVIVDEAHITAGAVGTTKIQNAAVTEPKLADDSVSSRTIQDQAVSEAHLADDSVSARLVQDSAIQAAHMADDSISSRTIQDNAVGPTHLADDSISSRTVQDRAIQADHLADASVLNRTLAPEVETRLTTAEERLDDQETMITALQTGDSGAAANAARLSVSGVTYDTLKDRLDTEYTEVTTQLEGHAGEIFTLDKRVNEARDINLIDEFRNGFHSPELFTLPNGVNEFDIHYVNGLYHLFYDDKTQTRHRQASTISGLSSASDDLTFAGRYPTAIYEEGTWHLWVWDQTSSTTKHYTSSSATGPYTYSDASPTNKADFHVRKHPYNGNYYAGYKDMSSGVKPMGVLVADSPNGPWTDLGHVFSNIGRAYWHSLEEADPAPFFFNGKSYVAFAGWDNAKQRVAVVEVDPTTMKAIYPAVCIVEPMEVWHKRNSQDKVFNPVFFPVEHEQGRERLYYAQNPNAAGIATGWGYVEVGVPLGKKRRFREGLQLDTWMGQNIATGIQATKHGTAQWGVDGVRVSSGTGGVYGHIGLGNLNDFTFTVEFTADTLPGAGVYNLLGRVSKQNAISATPVVGLWLIDSKIYAEIKNNAQTGNFIFTGTTVLTTGTRYRVSIRRLGTDVLIYINGVQEGTGTHSGALTGIEEWAIMNQQGAITTASQQFTGTLHSVSLVGEGLPIPMM